MSGEKTEKATSKRKKDERKKGNVFMSRDAVMAMSLVTMFFALKTFMPMIFSLCQDCIRYFFTLDSTSMVFDIRTMQRLMIRGGITFAMASLPLLLISVLVAVIITMAQTRMLFSTKAFAFKASRLDLLKGIQKMFSLRSVVELLKAIVKVTILTWVMYKIYIGILPTLPNMMDMAPLQAITFTAKNILTMAFRISIAFIALSAADYLYQWWEYEKNLRMSKQEIKDEYKQTEGDPQVKGHIRQLQQQRARQRMIQKVPDADVVIRNPTHYAVAIAYQKDKNRAPIVVAKGVDELALRIVAVAEEHGVYITEDKPLARALYAEVDLDREIPEAYYQPIAKVLAFVYSLKKKDLR